MAKVLLWLFVIVNSLFSFLLYSDDQEPSHFTIIGIWTAISVLAICESIEKTKAGKTK